ncbi:MAG: hypothetical protein Q9M43_15535 [Sulfurimonas sp.]|nr:hypothetical protein [Sulfurimonas sp.]
MDTNKYDMLISDMSGDVVKGLFLLKELTDKYPQQVIFALVLEKDEDKLFAIADLGVNAFQITPEQFEPAIEEIAKFNPYPDK